MTLRRGDPDVTGTVSQIADDDGSELRGAEWPRLVIALESRRPLAAPARLALTEIDEVIIGRGPERRWTRTGRQLLVELPDTELSRQHARLRRTSSGWELADLGSKNGTVVNRTPALRVTLADGDLIEAGGALLTFREDGLRNREPPRDRDLDADHEDPVFRTVDPELEARFDALTTIAASSVPVLVRGETGTGKELIARAIHERSGRRGGFVAINCGALPRTLIESELFGYKRGAFSGAKDDRDGLVRRADGGTLFLDEIAELPPESQVALLRVLQEGEVRPVGAAEPIRVDLRIIAATHQDLDIRISDNSFRQDLYARLAGFVVTLPPLRERRDDVGGLIATLLPRITSDAGAVKLQRAAARALLGYPYPLNVRELEQALRAAVVLARGGEIRLEHLPDTIRGYLPPEAAALRPEDRALKERILELLRDYRGNVTAASRALGKAPIQLRRWCRRFEIDIDGFRG